MSTVVADAPPPRTMMPMATPTTSFVELNLIYYYYLFIYHYVECDVVLSRCRHRQSIRADATALPPSGCAPPSRFALPPPPLMLPPPPCRRHAAADVALARCRHCQRHAVARPPPPLTLPLPPHRHQAAADVALSRYRHRRSLHADAIALLPSRCAPSPCFALLPLPPLLVPKSH
jgi:hypothetical protein